jgi:hypothetical protein
MQNDDGDGGMGSRLTHMFVRAGMYRLRASSLGDGGGGVGNDSLLAVKLPKAGKYTVWIGGSGAGDYSGRISLPSNQLSVFIGSVCQMVSNDP